MCMEDFIGTLGDAVLPSFLGAVLRIFDIAGAVFGLHFCHHRQYNEPDMLQVEGANHTLRTAVPSPAPAVLLDAILRSDVFCEAMCFAIE